MRNRFADGKECRERAYSTTKMIGTPPSPVRIVPLSAVAAAGEVGPSLTPPSSPSPSEIFPSFSPGKIRADTLLAVTPKADKLSGRERRVVTISSDAEEPEEEGAGKVKVEV
jgi:hypothetical protein